MFSMLCVLLYFMISSDCRIIRYFCIEFEIYDKRCFWKEPESTRTKNCPPPPSTNIQVNKSYRCFSLLFRLNFFRGFQNVLLHCFITTTFPRRILNNDFTALNHSMFVLCAMYKGKWTLSNTIEMTLKEWQQQQYSKEPKFHCSIFWFRWKA